MWVTVQRLLPKTLPATFRQTDTTRGRGRNQRVRSKAQLRHLTAKTARRRAQTPSPGRQEGDPQATQRTDVASFPTISRPLRPARIPPSTLRRRPPVSFSLGHFGLGRSKWPQSVNSFTDKKIPNSTWVTTRRTGATAETQHGLNPAGDLMPQAQDDLAVPRPHTLLRPLCRSCGRCELQSPSSAVPPRGPQDHPAVTRPTRAKGFWLLQPQV